MRIQRRTATTLCALCVMQVTLTGRWSTGMEASYEGNIDDDDFDVVFTADATVV